MLVIFIEEVEEVEEIEEIEVCNLVSLSLRDTRLPDSQVNL
jgi:hypothetical protein